MTPAPSIPVTRNLYCRTPRRHTLSPVAGINDPALSSTAPAINYTQALGRIQPLGANSHLLLTLPLLAVHPTHLATRLALKLPSRFVSTKHRVASTRSFRSLPGCKKRPKYLAVRGRPSSYQHHANVALQHIAPPKMMPSATSNPRRKSVFREVGLADDDSDNYAPVPTSPIHSIPILSPTPSLLRKATSPSRFSNERLEEVKEEELGDDEDSEYDSSDFEQRKRELFEGQAFTEVKAADVAAASGMTRLYRLCLLALLVFLVVPVTNLPFFGSSGAALGGAYAGVVPQGMDVFKRADSPTDVCTRWSHASKL